VPIDGLDVSDDVYELVATEVARDKLAARSIAPAEVEQVPRNEHRIVRNRIRAASLANVGCASARPMAAGCRRW
jgi:hypothetical protein